VIIRVMEVLLHSLSLDWISSFPLRPRPMYCIAWHFIDLLSIFYFNCIWHRGVPWFLLAFLDTVRSSVILQDLSLIFYMCDISFKLKLLFKWGVTLVNLEKVELQIWKNFSMLFPSYFYNA